MHVKRKRDRETGRLIETERCRYIENEIYNATQITQKQKIDTQKCMQREKETESQGGLKRLRDAVAQRMR